MSLWNAGFRLAGAFDGLPIPPTRLIFAATHGRVIPRFLYGGKMCHDSILWVLAKSGYDVSRFSAVLEFGCGCGRVTRYWKDCAGPDIYGTDINRQAVSWCKRNLAGIAMFSDSSLNPPLEFSNEKFDFVYAISVFTHLPEELQHSWIAELRRVIKPGGLLLISLHGNSRLHELSPAEQREYLSDRLVVKQPQDAGSNLCAAYHPQRYVYTRLADGFDVVAFDDVGLRDANQDTYLLKKRHG